MAVYRARGAPDPGAEPDKGNHRQPRLLDKHRHHAFFTTVDAEILDTVAADQTHRKHAIIEQINAHLKDSALAHMPSVIFSPDDLQASDLRFCVVDGVFDEALGWFASAGADSFSGLSPGRVAAGPWSEDAVGARGAESFSEGVAQEAVILLKATQPLGGGLQSA